MRSGAIRPAASASRIIATPIRSFTDAVGVKLSNLAAISALQFSEWGIRLSRTNGVRPTKVVMSGAIAIAGRQLSCAFSFWLAL